MPVTTPVAVFTVAAAVLLLLHAPPPVPLLVKVVVEPTQTDEAPVTEPALGNAFTTMLAVAVAVPQTPETVYVIVALPEPTPVTTPFTEFTVATVILLLLQLPPLAPLLVKVVVEPTHTADEPLTVPALGMLFTVTDWVAVAAPQAVITV